MASSKPKYYLTKAEAYFHPQVRIPGQVPSPEAMDAMRLMQAPPKKFKTSMMLEQGGTYLTPQSIVQNLGMDLAAENNWINFLEENLQADNELILRRAVLDKCRNELYDAALRKALLERALKAYRAMRKSIRLQTPEEILEKAKYTKRTGTPGNYKYEYGDSNKSPEKKKPKPQDPMQAEWEKNAGIPFPKTLNDLDREASKTFNESMDLDKKNQALVDSGKPVDQEAITKQTQKVRALAHLVDQQDWRGYPESEPLYRFPSAAGHFRPRNVTKSQTFIITPEQLLQKGGPYIGPRGGKYADPQFKTPWKEPSKGVATVGKTKSGKSIYREPKNMKMYEGWSSHDHNDGVKFFYDKESPEFHGSDMKNFHTAMRDAKMSDELDGPNSSGGAGARLDAEKYRKRAMKKIRQYKKENVTKSFQKADAKGGTYYKRAPAANGKGWRYFYDEDKYKNSKQSHIGGEEAAKGYVRKSIQKFVETNPEGCELKNLQPLVKKYGHKVVANILDEDVKQNKKLKYSKGKLYACKG